MTTFYRWLELRLGPNWRVRSLLAGVAMVSLLIAIVLRIVALETSLTVETTRSLPTPVPTSAATTPRPAAASTPAPSPSEKTTSVHTSGSDPLELGLLGFAALFCWMSIFYDRLSKISGPGGIGFELSPAAQQKASEVVASKAKERASRRVGVGVQPALGDALLNLPSLYQLTTYARSDQAAGADQVLNATEDTVALAGRATLRATEFAKQLLRLAGSPDQLRSLAASFHITDDGDLGDLMSGVVNDNVWGLLADRALTEAGLPPG